MVIFGDAEDYAAFTRMLAKVERDFRWDIVAYCLMPTHYHVVVDVEVERLSSGMQRLNGSYAHYFNRRHGRSGALFQGRFHTRRIDSDEYLAALCAYVPFNPVRAGHCKRPEDWPWLWSRYPLSG
jgi:putative transposase